MTMTKVQENGWIVGQQEMAQQTFLLRVRSPRIASLARAGQFVMLQVRDGTDPLLRRPLSFHRIFPEEGTIEMLYRVVGRGTWLLSRCAPETPLNLIGPLGNGFRVGGTGPEGFKRQEGHQGSEGHDRLEEHEGHVLLIAGGIGIAPLFELMVRLASRKDSAVKGLVRLFYGARTAAEMLPARVFDGMGATVHWSTDDGSLGYHGYVTQLVRHVIEGEGLRPALIYSCGPLAMQYHVAKWAAEHDVATQLSLESLMACGVGACLGCALPAVHPGAPSEDRFVHVCKDGPIFEAGSIQWHKIQMQQMCPPTFLFS
jgi:dihydroorotate dehydrogenase electron transfer subunit